MTEADDAPRARGLVAAAVLVAATAALWTTQAQQGTRELARAEAAHRRGDVRLAIEHARAAAFARCPGCRAPDGARTLLERIAVDAEKKGDDESAIAAWRAVRAGELSRRSPGAARGRAEAELARLLHRREAATATPGTPAPAAAAEASLRAVHAAEPSRAGARLLLAGAAIVWLGSLRSVVRGGRLGAAAVVGITAVGVAFLALWMM